MADDKREPLTIHSAAPSPDSPSLQVQAISPSQAKAAPDGSFQTPWAGWAALPPVLREGYSRLTARWRTISLETALFGLSLLAYLSTRLVGLVKFPIYFFTDEAANTVLAADFIRDHFHNYDGDFFPTFFINGGQYNLGPSVYLQIVPYLVFGKSVWVTRGTAVLATLIAAVSISLVLRSIFKIRLWWVGALVLSVIPAWFLHSRTAFETSLMVSFYAAFLFFYLLYRYRAPGYLFVSLVFGALAFYTYSAGQMVVLATGALLFISDARFHLKHWRTGLIGGGVLVVLALPYVRFLLTRGDANYQHLMLLGSYLISDLSMVAKAQRFGLEYLKGLNPAYWFLPNTVDLPRHLMKGYGHLSWFTFPFLLLGLVDCLKHFRSSAHRAVMAALLAAPSGAALVQLGITRALVMVIPAAILITLGVSVVVEWLIRRAWSKAVLSLALFSLLVGYNIFMLRDVLVNGPTWYTDYGLSGMQYGASQIFGEVKAYLARSPDTKIILTPTWANGTDVVARFFLPDNTNATLGGIDGFIFEHKPLDANTLFILTPEEYQRMLDSKKFTDVHIDKVMAYPDGSPGFYFLRFRYVDNIDAILAAEKEARRSLLSQEVVVDGQPATVRYSMLDMGPITNLFDGNPDSLARTLEANPMVVELAFPAPRAMRGLTLRVGGTATEVKVSLQVAGHDQALVFDHTFAQTPEIRDVPMDFGGVYPVTLLHLEVKNIYDSEPAHVHLWEITLR